MFTEGDERLFWEYWKLWSNPMVPPESEELLSLRDKCIDIFGEKLCKDIEWECLKEEAIILAKVLKEHPELDYREGEYRSQKKDLQQWTTYRPEFENWFFTYFFNIVNPENL